MLKNFLTTKNQYINLINDIELKYAIYSSYSFDVFSNIVSDISKCKIYSLLLLSDKNFFVNLRDITCDLEHEKYKWNINHINEIKNIIKGSKRIFDLITFTRKLEIISFVQCHLIGKVCKKIYNIFLLDSIYNIEGNQNFDIPTKNEYNYYFNMLEIINKVISQYFKEKDKAVNYDNILNDYNYCKLIEITSKNL